MKKIIVLIAAFLSAGLLRAQGIDYDNLAKEYKDIAIQALASMKPGTRKWVEETALKHPPGKFDAAWVNTQLKGLPNSLGSGEDPAGGLWALMMAYQKILNKEAKADRKQSRADQEKELKIKEAKIEHEITEIDQQKRESEERYNYSKNAAGNTDNKIIQTNIKNLQAQLAILKRNPNF